MKKPTAPQPEEKSGIAKIPDFCRYAERDSSAFLPVGRNICSHQFLNWWQQYATGILRFDLSSPSYSIIKKERADALSSFLVRRKGLEPPTY